MKKRYLIPSCPNLLLAIFLGVSLLFCCTGCFEKASNEKQVSRQNNSEQLENYIQEFVKFRRSGFSRELRTAEQYTIQANELREWLKKLESIPREGLTLDQDVDYRLIASDIKTNIARIERERKWEKDPGLYIPFESINSIVGNKEITAEEKERRLQKAFEDVPQTIATAKANLNRPAKFFYDRALDTLKLVLEFYRKEARECVEAMPTKDGKLKDAYTKALASVEDYKKYLEEDIKSQADGEMGIGRELYNYYLKETYMMDDDVDSLLRKGEQSFADTIQLLEETASRLDPKKTWQELIKKNRKHHPTADHLLSEWEKEIQRARQHVINKNLVIVPDGEKVVVVPTPPSRRDSSPFGLMSTPRPFSDSKLGTLVINPVDPDLPQALKEELLSGHDYTFISTIAPHETYPGHHLQALKVQENPRIIRKLIGSSLFGEGWGLYTEELMYETGFFKNVGRTRLTQLRTRLWRAARVILDAKLHTGKISYEDARRFLEEKVLFEPSRSAGEVNMYVASPTYVITYILGYFDIMKLRKEYKAKLGKDFSLLKFHEAMLKTGSLPTSILREVLLAEK